MSSSPLTSDDFEFATQHFDGLADIFRYVLYYGNGRVLGNLGSILLVRMPVLCAAVKSLVVAGVIFLVPTVLGCRKPEDYLLSMILFLAIPDSLFGQVYTWTSGFQNYVPPIWITLLIVCILQHEDFFRHPVANVLSCLCIVLLGFAGQLYVEHTSLINLVLAGALLYVRIKDRKNAVPQMLWLLSAVMGLAAMLLVPKLFYAAGNRSEGYRSVNLGSIATLIKSCVWAFSTMCSAFPLLGGTALSAMTILATYLTRNSRKPKWNNCLYSLAFIALTFLLLNEHLLHDEWYGRYANTRHFFTGCMVVLPFLLWCIALIPLKERTLALKIIFLLAVALISCVPLLIVSPTPERVIFMSYTLGCAAVILFASYARSLLSDPVRQWVKRGLGYTAAVVLLLLCMVFTNIRWLTNVRENHIQEQMAAGASNITIYRIPYDYIFWDDIWCFGRGYFYEEWGDITFDHLDYEVWRFLYLED